MVRLVLCALAVVGCARNDSDPPPRVGGPATVAADELPVWFGRPRAPTRRIAGTVRVDDSVVVGATVHLRIAAPDATVWVGRDLEAKDGAFDFGSQRAGKYTLLATAPGRTTRAIEIDIRDRDADAIALHLYRCVPVSRIVRANRRPLEGAAIDIAGVAVATTDRTGSFTVCAGNEPLVATVRASGFGAVSTTIDRAVHDRLPDGEIAMAATVPIEGDVMGLAEKRREGVAVSVMDQKGAIVPAQAMTDSSGRFTLVDAAVRGTRYTFRVIDNDVVADDKTTLLAAGSDEIAHVKLAYAALVTEPEATSVLNGLVVHGGAPLADAEVRIGDFAARTDLAGRYRLPYIAAVGAILRVAHPSGFSTARAIASTATEINVAVADVGTIAGDVVNAAGDPAPCRVRIIARTTAMDETISPGPSGHFSFPTVELGETYDLIAFDPNGIERARLEVGLDDSVPNITGLQVKLR